MLGVREPGIYGEKTYEDLVSFVREECGKRGIETEFYQSNHEGDIVDRIQQAIGVFDGIVINAGAYTHYSIAILDALKSVSIPAVEVHISDVNSREPFRRVSVIRDACIACVSGKGFPGYVEAALILSEGKR